MILYGVKQGKYYNIENFSQDLSDMEEKGFARKIYINVTNKCNCACTFCLRSTKQMNENNSLWLKEDNTAQMIISKFKEYDWKNLEEIIFCGFGEPTMCMDTVLEVAEYLKKTYKEIPIRLNTNGSANRENHRDVAKELQGLIDTVSISLNASNAEKYFEITRSKYKEQAYEDMLDFAVECKDYVPNVVMTIVDCIGEEEIGKCKKVCENRNLTLRIRPFET